MQSTTADLVLSFKLSPEAEVQAAFTGQVTQAAIKKFIQYLELSIDTFPESIARLAFEEAQAQDQFWADHWQEFLVSHLNKYIAIRDRQVVASHDDLETLHAILRDRDIDPTSVWVRFVTNDPRRHMH